MSLSSRLLITGGSGFTGYHLIEHFRGIGYNVHSLRSNILDPKSLTLEVDEFQPDYVIHLAAISYADFDASADYYNVNVVGSVNLLEAIKKKAKRIKKVILPSSAAVYGEQLVSVLSEELIPNPLTHYGLSKLSLEFASRPYTGHFPVLITRPFNYTGVRHSTNFLIPKIVDAYIRKQSSLKLGNLGVSREFNDVRDITKVYERLLLADTSERVVNICSGRLIPLLDIIKYMNSIAGYHMHIISDSSIVRANDVLAVSGDPNRLNSICQHEFDFSIEQTLEWMFNSGA